MQLTNRTATLADLTALVGQRVHLHRAASPLIGSRAPLDRDGVLVAASHPGEHLGVEVRGADWASHLALPAAVPWTITVLS